MNKLLGSMIVAAGLAFSGIASAGLSIVDGADPKSSGIIPGGTTTNDVLGSNVTWNGYYGGSVDSAAGRLTFTFIGFEAGNTNVFSIGGVDIFSTADVAGNKSGTISNPIGTTFTLNWIGGLLDFAFTSTRNGASETVENADNPNANPNGGSHDAGMDFFLSFNNSLDTSGSGPLYVFFDDFGAGPDDNHDDMVIMISYAVPAPGTLGLLGLGLFGLGFAARRRNTD